SNDRLDPGRRCEVARTKGCFSSIAGVVGAPSDSEIDDISVSYDDGLKKVQLDLQGEAMPELGTRVDLELWMGHRVAVYDHASERRYRTLAWPQGGMSVAKGLGEALVGLLLIVPAGIWLVRRCARLLRRRSARP
ncbi:MAG: hypothetical protein QOF43_108, partial [Gaiellaceae bacterium]|nr:hypothetical protein [Gaiellaceae bacterium]